MTGILFIEFPPQIPPPSQPPIPTLDPPLSPAGSNPALDFSRESLFSDEEERVDAVVLAPLKRRQLTREVQKRIQAQTDEYWSSKIRSLTMQGNFLSLLVEEDTNVTWKSYLWNVPRGVVKFAINSSLECLPTADNLKRWGKRASDLCTICNGQGKQTLNHVLSSCTMSLTQGRFTWRHDSVLRTLHAFINGKISDGYTLFTDLTGLDAGGGRVFPPNVIVTSQRPDMVVINSELRRVIIFELTCPFDSNVGTAHDYKMGKYASLVNDLQGDGYIVDLFCVEVSVRGQISKANRARIKSFLLKSTGLKRGASVDLICKLSKASLLSSFSIFCARNEAAWQLDRSITL